MSVIYMKHPLHGAKVAISEAEAIFDETHGWMRYNLDTSASAAPHVTVANEMAPKRRGRPRAEPQEF